MWSILRAKGRKTSLIKRRQKSTLIFSANINEAEGTSQLLLLAVWMVFSSREANWISPSPFLGSCGGDFPMQPNRNCFIWDLNHSSSLIFRSASCSLMQSWQNLLAASVKSRLFEPPGSKIPCFQTPTTCPLPGTPPNPTHCGGWYDHICMRNKEWQPEALQLILNCSHDTTVPSDAFWKCYHMSEMWPLSLLRSQRLAEGCAKGKSALMAKPAQPALFQNMMENALLCSAFLLSVKV